MATNLANVDMDYVEEILEHVRLRPYKPASRQAFFDLCRLDINAGYAAEVTAAMDIFFREA